MARITDGQFISQSEAMGAHYGALAREIVKLDFREAWRPWVPIKYVTPVSITIEMRPSTS